MCLIARKEHTKYEEEKTNQGTDENTRINKMRKGHSFINNPKCGFLFNTLVASLTLPSTPSFPKYKSF